MKDTYPMSKAKAPGIKKLFRSETKDKIDPKEGN